MVGSYTETITQTIAEDVENQQSLDLPVKILELQKKIQDENYLEYAIDRIAVVMSRHIVDAKSLTGNSVEYLSM